MSLYEATVEYWFPGEEHSSAKIEVEADTLHDAMYIAKEAVWEKIQQRIKAMDAEAKKVNNDGTPIWEVIVEYGYKNDTHRVVVKEEARDKETAMELAESDVEGDMFWVCKQAEKVGGTEDVEDEEDIRDDIIMEVNREGYLVLSVDVCGHLFSRCYLYYSEEEALELFLEEVKNEKEKSKIFSNWG